MTLPGVERTRTLVRGSGARRRALGAALALGGGALLSLAGITLRHMESAGGWQILFFRSLTFFVVVAAYLAIRYRARVVDAFVRVGKPGIVVALSLGLGSACYVFALLLTTVANALFIISAAPFMTAILGWLWLRERVTPVTWAAMTFALAGIAIMVVNGVQSGRLLGNVVAFGPPVSFAIMLVALRSAGSRDMIPAICLAGLVGVGLGLAMADSLAITRHDLLLCLFLGVVQYTGGFVLLALGARYLPAAEVALLALSEIVLAPIWVWIGVGEVPALATLVGGGIVLSAVVAQAATGVRSPEGQQSGAGAGASTGPAGRPCGRFWSGRWRA